MPDAANPLWFLVSFVVLWIAIAAALSLMSGWWSLASRFAAGAPERGERLRFVSGAVGAGLLPVNYGRSLFLTISDKGICLEVLFLLRVLSPPLFIPWEEMESVEEKRLLFRKYTAIRIRGQRAGLSLYGEAGRRVLAAHAGLRG